MQMIQWVLIIECTLMQKLLLESFVQTPNENFECNFFYWNETKVTHRSVFQIQNGIQNFGTNAFHNFNQSMVRYLFIIWWIPVVMINKTHKYTTAPLYKSYKVYLRLFFKDLKMFLKFNKDILNEKAFVKCFSKSFFSASKTY